MHAALLVHSLGMASEHDSEGLFSLTDERDVDEPAQAVQRSGWTDLLDQHPNI